MTLESVRPKSHDLVPTEPARILSKQPGATVCLRGSFVEKSGNRVMRREEAALRLVQHYTDVPVPTVFSSSYQDDFGFIRMSYLNGETLDRLWYDDGDERIKEHICRQIWRHIYNFRQIPKPTEFSGFFQCSADGTASHDVLLQPLAQHITSPLTSDIDLRARIYERYLHFNGRRYEKELPAMLLQAEESIFTHGDIVPRNIVIGEGNDCPVIGIIDWECAGWYPEYWEYANILKPSVDTDWQMWMKRTAPKEWDISGLAAARRVLF